MANRLDTTQRCSDAAMLMCLYIVYLLLELSKGSLLSQNKVINYMKHIYNHYW